MALNGFDPGRFEPAVRLVRENSFHRLRQPCTVLAAPGADGLEAAVRTLCLWPPAVAELFEGPDPLVLARPVGAYTVLKLLDAGVETFYGDEGGAFVPWGWQALAAMESDRLLRRDGSVTRLDRRQARNLLESVVPRLPPVTVATRGAERTYGVPLRLVPGRTSPPSLLVFDPADYEDLCRLLGLDRLDAGPERASLEPLGLSFLFVSTPEGRRILLFAREGFTGPRGEALWSLAQGRYHSVFEDVVYVRTGRVLSPELPPAILRRVFDVTSLHLLWDEGGTCRRLEVRNAVAGRGTLDDLAELLFALRVGEVRAFFKPTH
ncbi:MAG: hypothetical protein KA419_14800 [Acidobacteria bacterium]|nr:hypothetical protein [Acidobacteriota bacterium]